MARKLPVVGGAASPPVLTHETIFREVFLPHYPPGVSLEATRRTDANPAQNPDILRAIDETANIFSGLAEEALGVALELDGSDASIHRLSAALTSAARDALYARKHAGERLLLLFVAHAAIYVGRAIVNNHGGTWLVRNPLWETRVLLTSKAGTAELCPFTWLLKTLADPPKGTAREHATTLADRYRTLVEVPSMDAATWPVLATPRRVPRLGRVRYDTLFQHLKTHVPELQDFGVDFPSPERFAELEFVHLNFLLVGGGRALLVWGPSKAGIRLFWMSNEGFSKAVFIEGDSVPEPLLTSFQREGPAGLVECIKLAFTKDGEPREFESLWWGP